MLGHAVEHPAGQLVVVTRAYDVAARLLCFDRLAPCRRRSGTAGLWFSVCARGSPELVYAFGQTALADTDGCAADVADGPAKLYVEPGRFGEADLLTGIDAPVPNHQEGCCCRQ